MQPDTEKKDVGRAYAGVLAPLALILMIARGLLHGGSVEQILPSALGAFWIFLFVGLAIGKLAGWFVDQSIREDLARKIESKVSGD